MSGVAPAPGQLREMRFERVVTANGLPSSSIYSILLDHQGFLWFGTGDGLCRYDGVQFMTVHGDIDGALGPGQNLIYDCILARNDLLWCATPGGGILRYDPIHDSTSRLTTRNNHLSSDMTYAVCEDVFGTLWVGSSGGLDTLDHASGEFHRVFRGASDGARSVDVKIAAVREFPRNSGMIWIGTWGEGLLLFDRIHHTWSAWREQPVDPRGPADGHVRSLFMSPEQQGDLWMGTEEGGLYQLRIAGGRLQRHPLYAGRTQVRDPVKCIDEDARGNLLISTLGNGLFCLDAATGDVRRFSSRPGDASSLLHDDVRCTCVDSGGVIWIGTRSGINKVDPIQGFFTTYRPDEHNPAALSNGMVYGLCEDREGIIWICTDGGGLNAFNRQNGEWHVYRSDPHRRGTLVTDRLTSVFEDRHGDIWTGGLGGWLHRLHKSTGKFDAWQVGLQPFDPWSMNVLCILEDSKGRLWLGTTQGLVRFDPQSGVTTPVGWDGLPTYQSRTSHVLGILEDHAGNFWIATRSGGVHLIDPSRGVVASFSHVAGDSTSLSLSCASAIMEDRDGHLWVGTGGGGLNLFNPPAPAFRCYTKRDGLSDDDIYALLEDRHGRIWISTGRGLSTFDPRTGTWLRFDTRDGLAADEFNTGSALRCADGTLCFGGVSGLTLFRPDPIYVNTHAPPIVITVLEQDGRPILEGRGTTFARSIILPPSHDVLGIGFSALDYRRPERNLYTYRLEGIDREWVPASTRNFIAYSNLPPGSYLFRVRGSNDAGIWSARDRVLTVIVQPHFWQTWWFRLLATLVVAVVLVLTIRGVYRRKIGSLRRDKLLREEFTRRQIESQEAERKRLAAELHDGLGQDLLVASNELKQFLHEHGSSREEVTRAASLVESSIQTIREISSHLHPHQLDRLGFCAALESMCESIARATGLAITCSCRLSESRLPKETEIHVYRIVQEALANVVRHASATEVSVHVSTPSRILEVSVTDNGTGFNGLANAAGKASQTSHGGRGGFGLPSMNERARIIGGTLAISSEEGSGTRVVLTVPRS